MRACIPPVSPASQVFVFWCRVVHDAPMDTPTTPQRVRLTISVSPEVHQTFTRMAQAGSMSVGRAMGDWLQDTMDAATHVTHLLERARSAPRQITQEIHAYALGLADETNQALQSMRGKEGLTRAADAASAVPPGLSPPSGNTGAKVPPPQGGNQ